MTANSGESPDSLHDLPVKHCQSRFCPNRGPFTDRRIVAVGRYDPEIIGWCNTCSRYVCLACACTRDPGQDASAQAEPEAAMTFCCRHCGEPLGVGETPFVLPASGEA